MVWASLLKEPLKVVSGRPGLALATTYNSRVTRRSRAACRLIVVTTGRGYDPLKMLLMPLLDAFCALLDALDGYIGWHFLTPAWGCHSAAWGRVKCGFFIVDGVFTGNIVQLPDRAPRNVDSNLKGWRLLHVMHATSRHLHPGPFGAAIVFPSAAMLAVAWVLRVAFRLRAHLASLMMSLGFIMLALLP
jgi:hypothetical protein